MKNILRQLQFIMFLLFGMFFTNNINANSIENTNLAKNVSIETTNYLTTNNSNTHFFKDGKWKERWASFLEGFLDGFRDGVGSINNSGSNGSNNPGFSKEELLQLTAYASKLKSKKEVINQVYQIDQLINADSPVITEKQMLKVFNGNDKIIDIIKKGMKNSTFPTRENVNKRTLKSVSISKPVLKAQKRAINKDVIFIDKNKSPGKFWKVLGYVVGWIAGNFVKG